VRLAGLALIAALLSATAWAGKEEREAKALFGEGKRLAESGDYAGAAEMFQSAYARYPNPKILVNLGAVLEALGRNAEAAEAYEKFIADPSSPKSKKAEMGAKLATLEKALGKLRVDVEPNDARITLDGKVESRTPPFVVRLNPGGHALVFERDGYAPAAHSLDVVAGREHELAVKLRPAGEPAPPPVVSTPPVPPAREDPAAPVEQPAGSAAPAEGAVEARVEPEMPAEDDGALSHAGQLGFTLRGESDLKDVALGPTAGVTYGALSWLELSGLALIQKITGARLAASALLLPRSAFKPLVRLGVPMFFEGGTHAGIHGGAGLQWDMSRNLGIAVDISIEHFPDLGGEAYTAVVAGAGVQARAF
jgi:hypothetical protein